MYFPDTSPTAIVELLPAPIRKPAEIVVDHLQHGTFQRSMSLLVVATSVVTGLEVSYEHYKGSYSNPVMYTPILLSAVLSVAGVAGFYSRRAATTFMRYTSAITFLDGVVGFGFHIRGIARKPGGWRMPITNIVMGPPILAPLLFGTSAYLGFLGSYLQREEDAGTQASAAAGTAALRRAGFGEDIRLGRFQKHLCVVTAIATFCSGAESWYSHYKNNFRLPVQWSPVILTPLLMGAALGSLKSERCANTALPLASAAAMLDGVVGTYYHARGIINRSGGTKKLPYNIIYGPPIFAPMLFAASGLLGMLAYLMRREPN